MLLNITKTLNLGATQEEAWRLLRDIDRLATLIPSVQSLAPADQPAGSEMPVADSSLTGSSNRSSLRENYMTRVVEKVGPFRLDLNLNISLVEAAEPSLLKAELSGADRNGQNRIKGTLSADLKEDGPATTRLSFNASVEVLGKLASLGAAPIRRRADELFTEFANQVQQQFPQAEQGPLGEAGLQAEEKAIPAILGAGPPHVAGEGKPIVQRASLVAGGITGTAMLAVLLSVGIAFWAALPIAVGLGLLTVLMVVRKKGRTP